MLYPNLTAEYEAIGYHIDTFADHAETTSEIMHDVFYGNGDLTPVEAYRLYCLVCRGTAISFNYLISPVVSRIDMTKNKNKYRAYMLMKKIDEADAINIGADADGYVDVYRINATEQVHRREIEWARKVLNNMLSGVSVRYAFYREAMVVINHIIGYYEEKNRPRRSIPIKQSI